jgi:hypothetical protein
VKKSDILPEQKYLLWGIPFIFAAGAALHYLYELTGERAVIGALAPVNESVWEHTKMVYLPTLAWWGGGYRRRRDRIDADRWFSASMWALLSSIVSMPALYYLYTGILGRHLLAVDISLLAVCAAIGQVVGAHVYRRGRGRPGASAAAAVILGIGAVFAIFTFRTPRLPIFRDGLTGRFGIR